MTFVDGQDDVEAREAEAWVAARAPIVGSRVAVVLERVAVGKGTRRA